MMKFSIWSTQAGIALALGCSVANVARAQFMDRVLVIVNEDVITQAEFDYRLKAVSNDFVQAGQNVPDDLPKQLLEGMISDKLQIQEAQSRGIEVSDEELERAIEIFAKQQELDTAQLQASIEQEGQSYALFRTSIRDSLTISRFTEFYAQRRVRVPQYEIDTEMKVNKLDQDDSEYQVAHILIKEPDQNLDLAQQVRDQLDNGLSFQQAVLTYSEATDAQQGGVIGWATAQRLPTIYGDAVKQMRVGDVSPVLVSGGALHILKLLDRRGGDVTEIIQSKVRHILISAESDVARSQASKKLFRLRQRIVDGEDFDQLARIFSDDSVSAASGGSLGWVSPGEMVKPFEDTFEQLPLGEISEPVVTQFGVHIMVVEDRRKKNVTEQIKRRRVEDFLRRKRADREYKQWVSELMEGAYIERVADPMVSGLKS